MINKYKKIFSSTFLAFALMISGLHSSAENKEPVKDHEYYRKEMYKAYETGDVAALKKIKEESGVNNVDDFGGVFMQYGSFSESWNKLIADVEKKNQEKENKTK